MVDTTAKERTIRGSGDCGSSVCSGHIDSLSNHVSNSGSSGSSNNNNSKNRNSSRIAIMVALKNRQRC